MKIVLTKEEMATAAQAFVCLQKPDFKGIKINMRDDGNFEITVIPDMIVDLCSIVCAIRPWIKSLNLKFRELIKVLEFHGNLFDEKWQPVKKEAA